MEKTNFKLKNFLSGAKSNLLSPKTPSESPTTPLSPLKIFYAAGIFVIAILLISLIALIVQNSTSQDLSPHADIVLDTTPYVFFENHYILDQNLSATAYQSVMKDLQSVILSPTELASAPAENDPSSFLLPSYAYDALIDPASFTRRTTPDYKQLDFIISISDGRTYTVTIRAYGSPADTYYYGLIIYKESTAHAFITFLIPGSSDPASRADYTYDRSSAVATLEDWFPTLLTPGTTLTTTVTDL